MDPVVEAQASLKRKRDLDIDQAAAPSKTAKTSSHLAINYLARQYSEDLPFISSDDTLPSILTLVESYHGVLDRHESLACNLGARALGPILIQRFERLFDGPPKVLKCHAREGTTVTWLDVVEFARNKPEQFTLAQMSEGTRVCQFYTKQCRVQITEEDFVLINSGIPQKMIPPQPIIEDEEKELGTLELVEKNMNTISKLADDVAARTRQLRHRINARKQAILDRRASDTGVSVRAPSPSNIALANGNGTSQSPGFVAVNARQVSDTNGGTVELSRTGASAATRAELLSKFFTVSDQRARKVALEANGEHRVSSAVPMPISGAASISRPVVMMPTSKTDASSDPYAFGPNVSIPPNPPSPFAQNNGNSKENDGPYKTEMMSRMESIKRGDRIMPPCDRCRRLHMDCIKNLTACLGCTKKHAKCSWKDVRAEELTGGPISFPGNEADVDAAEREPSVGYPPNDPSSSNGNGPPTSESPNIGTGPNIAGPRAIALNAAPTSGLATTAEANGPETQQSRHKHPHPHAHPNQIRTPDVIPAGGHQSSNISTQPPYQSRTSVNTPYATAPRASSPEAKHSGSNVASNAGREPLSIRAGDGLLAS